MKELTNYQAKRYGLTRKQTEFIRQLLGDKKMSAKQAVKNSYNVTTEHSAEVIASENLRKPEIMAILEDYDLKAQTALVDGLTATRQYWDSKGEEREVVDHQTRLRAADSVLDRIHGKATQRTEVTRQSVNINLNLDGISSVTEVE